MSYSDTNGDGVITADEVLSENNYYPFGLQHQGDNPAVAQANKAAEKYKYNGKEFQDELGINLYDYGARNYDAALGRWFNVDPLAEQFPGWTPYHYVHNNPINLIDPTGMAAVDGDYYNKKGDKIGTDGINDNKKYIVTDDKEVSSISKTKGNVDASKVKSGVTLPSDVALRESLNVLDRTIDNGGLREESSLVMNNGNIIKGATGELPTKVDGVQTAKASLPSLPIGSTIADVESTIHSHPTKVQESNGLIFPQSANSPSAQDWTTFSQYGTNIIVGPLGTISSATRASDGSANFPKRSNGAVIYRNGQQPVELKRNVIEKILR